MYLSRYYCHILFTLFLVACASLRSEQGNSGKLLSGVIYYDVRVIPDKLQLEVSFENHSGATLYMRPIDIPWRNLNCMRLRFSADLPGAEESEDWGAKYVASDSAIAFKRS